MTAQTRITAGAWRGRAVLTPRGREVRPTTSLVRQALFDILGAAVVDAEVLDLYAGAGTVSFEALSRGAAHATMVERDRGAVELMRRTAETLGCDRRCTAVCADVPRWLAANPAASSAADLCFLDAPYRDDGVEGALRLLGEAPPAFVVCEHHRARVLPDVVGGLATVRRARYGMTALTILRRAADRGSSMEA